MKTGVMFLVTLLILLKYNLCLFSDSKPTKSRRGKCGEGRFRYNNTDQCMPCNVACKISKESCRLHDCLVPPNVQVKSSKTVVTENESVQLECVTSGGTPEYILRYRWRRNTSSSTTVETLFDTKINNRDGKILDLPRIPYDKSGTYTCKAWNLAGKGEGSIDIDVQYPPRIRTGLVKFDVIGEMGKEASFKLYIIANPAPAATDYVWSRADERLLTQSPNYAFFSGPTWSKLIIKKVTSHDYTNYTCSVQTHGFQAKVFKFRLLNAAPQMSVIGVSRADTKVTIRWQQVIGHYTAIKVKYCQTGTDDCVIYIVPNPGDTSATLLVNPDKTYYYHVVIEDDGDVVYKSNPLVVDDSGAKTDMAPKISVIDVSRSDNTVTIRWKQVIGNYTAIKIKFCQTGTDDCQYHIVPNPKDTSANLFVDPNKTYYYYMMIEDGSGAIHTSNPLVVDDSDAKTDMVAVTIGGSVTGAVILTATCVILAVVLWKRRRSRNKLKNQPANYTNDDDATRIVLAAIKNSPRHTYANIGAARVNHISSHSARTAKQYPVNPRGKMQYLPANRVPVGGDPAYSDDDVDIDQYDYADTRWLRDASGSCHSPVTSRQGSGVTWRQDVSAQIHVPAHQANHSDPESSASSYQDMQAGVIVSIERQREQEPEGTYNDVRIMATQGELQQCTTCSELGQATWQHVVPRQNLVPAPGANQDDPMDASSHEDMSGRNVSQDSSYDDVRIVTQGDPAHSTPEGCLNQATHELKPYVLCEKKLGQEPEGTNNDVVGGLGQAGLAKKLTQGRFNDDEANGQQSRYEHLEPEPVKPVSRHEYLDFRGLIQKQMKPQILANPNN